MMRLLQVLLLMLCGAVCAQVPDPLPVNPDSLLMEIPPAEVADEGHLLVPAPGKEAETEDNRPILCVPKDQTRVAVLGYHNFSKTAPVTNMLMRTEDFRKQMEHIRARRYTVISMQDFLDWRFGEKLLPARCVLITLDDGWKSVYTDAFPILKEFGYPFTLFLYTNYLHGRGDSLSPEQVMEMMQHGATIGSHSTSHLYPSAWRKLEKEEDPAPLMATVEKELGDSARKLRRLFGAAVDAYCYPGGYHNPAMLEALEPCGYKAAFTVIPGKVTVAENPQQIHRYMVFGDNHSIFRSAMDFRNEQAGTQMLAGAAPGSLPQGTPPPPFDVSPKPGETVGYDIPAITAYLSGVQGVELSSVRMKVSGFGRVPVKVDQVTRTVQWVPPFRIYMPNISVHVTWNSADGTRHKAEWSFKVAAPSMPD